MPPPVPPSGNQNAGGAAQSPFEGMEKLAPNIEKMTKTLEAMLSKMGDVDKASESIGKKMRGWEMDVKSTVQYMEEVHERTKALLSIQKQMAAASRSVNSTEEAKEYLKALLQQTEALEKMGHKSKEFTDHLKKQKEAVVQISEALNEGRISYSNAMNEVDERIPNITKKLSKIASATKDIHLSGFMKDITHADRAVSALLGKTSKLDKFRDIQAKRDEFKSIWKEKIAAKKASYAEKIGGFEASPFDAKTHGRSYKGMSRGDKLKAVQEDERNHVINEAARRAEYAGGGKFAKWVAKRTATNASMGKGPGLFNTLGQKIIEHGEGSEGKGLASGAASLLEGGAAAAIIPAAIIGGILESIKKLFDANAVRNAAINEKLTSGGILRDGQNPLESISNVQANLRGPMFSRLGIGYEKNLEIAKTLNDSGIGVKNLSGGSLGMDKYGAAGGSFGTLQRNVYGLGKVAGLDSNQTMATTLKLITGFAQSLHSTEDFFVAVDKDSRAAGISVIKYIDIIEGVNEQYDRTNKNLNETVSIMKLLSSTGRATAQDLQEMVTGLTAGDKERSLEISTYLNMQNLQNPTYRKEAPRQAQQAVDNNVNEVSKATGKSVEEIKRGLTGSPEEVSRYLNDLQDSTKNIAGGNDPLAIKAASNTVENLRQSVMNQSALKDALKKGGAEGGLGLATYQKSQGNTMYGAFQKNLGAVYATLGSRGYHLSDLANEGSKVYSDPEILKFAESMNLNLGDFGKQFRQGTMANADDIIEMGKEGARPEDNSGSLASTHKKEMMDEVYSQLKKKGFKSSNPNASSSDAVQEYLKTNGTRGESIVRSIAMTDSKIADTTMGAGELSRFGTAVTKAMTDAQMDEAKHLTDGTRTTADIFANAFERLFQMLLAPLQFLEKHFGGGGPNYASDDQTNAISALSRSGVLDVDFATKSKQLESRRSDASKLPEKQQAAAMAQIDADQAQLERDKKSLADYNSGTGGVDLKGGYDASSAADTLKMHAQLAMEAANNPVKSINDPSKGPIGTASVTSNNPGGKAGPTQIIHQTNNNVQATSAPNLVNGAVNKANEVTAMPSWNVVGLM